MQDAGDADGGSLGKTPPIDDTTVELRKSCDFCVRLKRACDGKNPCSLCSRRHKPCTRSARKKSGPAKGTKYAPRRKRSAIAEWADRAAVGQPHDYAQGGGGGGDGGGRAPPVGDDSHPSGLLHAASAGGAHPFLETHPAAAGRRGGELWSDQAVQSGSRGRRVELPPPPSSSALPFPADRLVKQEGMGHGGAVPRLEPQPTGLVPPATAVPSRRRHSAAAAAWSPQSMETGVRSARSAPGSARGAEEMHGGLERSLAPQPRSLSMEPPRQGRMWESPPRLEGYGESAGMGQRQERIWEPFAGEWASRSDVSARHLGSAHSKRLRVSAPSLVDTGRWLHGQGPDAYGAASSPRGSREEASGSSAHSPERRLERRQPESSPTFRPLPREPPDPTAGFTFRPAAQLLSWRRPSYPPPWETRDELGAPRAHSPHLDFSDRPTSWSSAGGSGGGGTGASASGEFMGNRGYHEGFRRDSSSARETEAAEWRLPQGEGDLYRERPSLRPPYGFERNQPVERPLVGGGDEREGDPPPAEGPRGGLPPSGATPAGRPQIFARASVAGPFERQLERSIGRFPPAAAAAAAELIEERTAGAAGDPNDPRVRQQRVEGRRQGQGPSQDSQGWEGYFPAVGIVATPLVPPPESGSGSTRAGAAGTDPRDRWPEVMSTAPDAREGGRRETGSGSGGGGSTPSQQWEPARGEGHRGDRFTRVGGSTPLGGGASSSTAAAGRAAARPSLEQRRGDSTVPTSSSASAESRQPPVSNAQAAAAAAAVAEVDEEGKEGYRRPALRHPRSPSSEDDERALEPSLRESGEGGGAGS